MKELIKGAYDLHFHSDPDIVKRKDDDVNVARHVAASGMKGYASKCHYSPTADRVMFARKAVPECDVVSSLTLNSTVGGINPAACECAVRQGARIIWFPTLDAAAEHQFIIDHAPDLVSFQLELRNRGVRVDTITATDEDGKLTEESAAVLEIARMHNIIAGTGHLSHDETFALADRAYEIGFDKLVITHVNLSATRYSISDQKKLIDRGATLERSYVNILNGSVSWGEEAAEIRELGADHIILTSDLGRPDSMYPDEGLLDYIGNLMKRGISENEIRRMIVDNPVRLLSEIR